MPIDPFVFIPFKVHLSLDNTEKLLHAQREKSITITYHNGQDKYAMKPRYARDARSVKRKIFYAR